MEHIELWDCGFVGYTNGKEEYEVIVQVNETYYHLFASYQKGDVSLERSLWKGEQFFPNYIEELHEEEWMYIEEQIGDFIHKKRNKMNLNYLPVYKLMEE